MYGDDQTIEEVKGQIQYMLSIPVQNQRLINAWNTILDDNRKTLADYGIKCGETLHLVVTLPG